MAAATAFACCRNKYCLFDYYKQFSKYIIKSDLRRASFTQSVAPSFGLLFDIDGVIVRGKRIIPRVPEAFRRLVNEKGNFRVPTVFVTNAGNAHCKDKAKQLSEWLGVQVSEDKVVMSHTPLKNFYEFHKKCVLVSGQGPIEEIAGRLGFINTVTVENLRRAFPLLDAVDQKRRVSPEVAGNPNFPKIEAVILFGEPVRWETSLQLILDVIMTNGSPSHHQRLSYPHIPVLACNMDLQWMAEANIPRFGHGAFLVCLEELYKKITGKNLMYTALIGKPSEITYQFAHQLLLYQAHNIGIVSNIKHLYAIGDNINTDIFGANLYNDYLSSINKKTERAKHAAVAESHMRLVFFQMNYLIVILITRLETFWESISLLDNLHIP
ncbi:haloacid dehalogenase-like hydrolase domain-containing 5 isoform X2 [Lycorma delicatula]|uniref:haloacid dehalogenase-like hydrolase domain-containing 5 isoform X2 n=1 Tax=Lycorma delicatula TaxID=130591 RepID=UPI003F5149BB